MKRLILLPFLCLIWTSSLNASNREALVESYRMAHETKDLELFLSLVEFAPSTPQWMREQMIESFKTDADLTITDITLEPIDPDFQNSFEYEGIKYVPTLDPRLLLNVSFDEAGQGAAMITGTVFTIGEANGVLRIVSAKPVQALGPSTPVMNSYFLGSRSDSSGESLLWTADSNDIKATKAWNGLDAIPFALDELSSIARDYLQTKYHFSQVPPVDGVWLQRIDRSGNDSAVKDRWFVTVTFAGDAAGILENSVRLLTDGTVITPTKASP